MEFKKVVIIGAGAVGCYILWGLSHQGTLELSVIASGKRFPEHLFAWGRNSESPLPIMNLRII